MSLESLDLREVESAIEGILFASHGLGLARHDAAAKRKIK